MRGTKRKAPEAEDDLNAARDALMLTCHSWRDACGRAFNIRTPRRAEQTSNCFTQRVQRFDRLACDALVAACGGAGAYSVAGFEARLPEGEVAFRIVRRGENPHRPPLLEAAAEVRVPALPNVLPEDAAFCAEAARALLRMREGSLAVKRRAETYEIALLDAGTATEAWCSSLARWPKSYVDFERNAIVAVVTRCKPDI